MFRKIHRWFFYKQLAATYREEGGEYRVRTIYDNTYKKQYVIQVKTHAKRTINDDHYCNREKRFVNKQEAIDEIRDMRYKNIKLFVLEQRLIKNKEKFTYV